MKNTKLLIKTLQNKANKNTLLFKVKNEQIKG